MNDWWTMPLLAETRQCELRTEAEQERLSRRVAREARATLARQRPPLPLDSRSRESFRSTRRPAA